MAITFDKIAEANKGLKSTNIKGKEYIEVNERVKAFRILYPEGTIETDIIHLDTEAGLVVMKATASNDGKVLGTGMSYEREASSYINKTSYIENCETSAVGRALGFLYLGSTDSICSADELENALQAQARNEKPRRTFPMATPPEPKGDNFEPLNLVCEECGKAITPTTDKDGNEMSALTVATIARARTKRTLCAACTKAALK